MKAEKATEWSGSFHSKAAGYFKAASRRSDGASIISPPSANYSFKHFFFFFFKSCKEMSSFFNIKTLGNKKAQESGLVCKRDGANKEPGS